MARFLAMRIKMGHLRLEEIQEPLRQEEIQEPLRQEVAKLAE